MKCIENKARFSQQKCHQPKIKRRKTAWKKKKSHNKQEIPLNILRLVLPHRQQAALGSNQTTN